MIDHLNKHSQKLLNSNLGIMLALMTCFIWVAHTMFARQTMDIPSAVSLFGFLLLFFIERAHGREMKAIQLKLDELLATQAGASNRLIRVEEAPENIVNSAHEALHELAAQKHPHDVVSVESFFQELDLVA